MSSLGPLVEGCAEPLGIPWCLCDRTGVVLPLRQSRGRWSLFFSWASPLDDAGFDGDIFSFPLFSFDLLPGPFG